MKGTNGKARPAHRRVVRLNHGLWVRPGRVDAVIGHPQHGCLVILETGEKIGAGRPAEEVVARLFGGERDFSPLEHPLPVAIPPLPTEQG